MIQQVEKIMLYVEDQKKLKSSGWKKWGTVLWKIKHRKTFAG